MNVWVVTNTELGWDCVVAVYSNKEAALKFANGEVTMIITDLSVEDSYAGD